MLFEKELHIFSLHWAMQITLAFGRHDSELRAAPFVYSEALQTGLPPDREKQMWRSESALSVCHGHVYYVSDNGYPLILPGAWRLFRVQGRNLKPLLEVELSI